MLITTEVDFIVYDFSEIEKCFRFSVDFLLLRNSGEMFEFNKSAFYREIELSLLLRKITNRCGCNLQAFPRRVHILWNVCRQIKDNQTLSVCPQHQQTYVRALQLQASRSAFKPILFIFPISDVEIIAFLRSFLLRVCWRFKSICSQWGRKQEKFLNGSAVGSAVLSIHSDIRW